MNNGQEYLRNLLRPFTGPSHFEFPVAERGKIWGASREELTEKGSRKVYVLPCTKAFGEHLDRGRDRLGRGKGAGKQREEISLVPRV